MNTLTNDQHAHLVRVIAQNSNLMRMKFARGQAEHGGDLHKKPGMLGHALDEIADLAVYAWTLREQLVLIAHKADARGERETAAAIRRLLEP